MNFDASNELYRGSGRSEVLEAVILPMSAISSDAYLSSVIYVGRARRSPSSRGTNQATITILNSQLCLFRTVTAARLLSTIHTQRIAATAYDLITNPWKVANTTTTDQNNRVLLKVMAFTGNVNRDFLAIAQPNPRDLTQSGVRLFRSHRPNQQTNTLLLRALLQNRTLCPILLDNSISTNQLIDGWHTKAFSRKFKHLRNQRPSAPLRNQTRKNEFEVPKVGVEPTRP